MNLIKDRCYEIVNVGMLPGPRDELTVNRPIYVIPKNGALPANGSFYLGKYPQGLERALAGMPDWHYVTFENATTRMSNHENVQWDLYIREVPCADEGEPMNLNGGKRKSRKNRKNRKSRKSRSRR